MKSKWFKPTMIGMLSIVMLIVMTSSVLANTTKATATPISIGGSAGGYVNSSSPVNYFVIEHNDGPHTLTLNGTSGVHITVENIYGTTFAIKPSGTSTVTFNNPGQQPLYIKVTYVSPIANFYGFNLN